jgi:hypothetical protein
MTGGLGNQLFKFFNAVDLSLRLKTEFQLDLSWYLDSRDRRGLTSQRAYDLDYFGQIAVVDARLWRSVHAHRRFGQIMRHLPEEVRKSIGYLNESSREYFLREARAPRFVDGSFERLSNLPAPNIILEYLDSEERESPWLVNLSKVIAEEAPIAMHIRMGDFLNLPEMYNVIKPSYYSNAVEIFSSQNNSPPIHLFSDDPERALLFLPKGITPQRVIQQEIGVKTAEIFLLMSRYPNLISANSTFSWWAGYLGFLKGTMSQSSLPERFLKDPDVDPLKHLLHAGSLVVPN